jgi:hypothetical protein
MFQKLSNAYYFIADPCQQRNIHRTFRYESRTGARILLPLSANTKAVGNYANRYDVEEFNKRLANDCERKTVFRAKII